MAYRYIPKGYKKEKVDDFCRNYLN